MQERSGKPAFNKPQLLNAIKEMGNCHPEIAARTLRIMQHASIRPEEIDLEQVPQTMKAIGCSPEEAVSVMNNIKNWEHTPNRPLSDIGILHRMFQQSDLRYTLNIYKFIENYESGRISEENWSNMSSHVTGDINELQAEAMEVTGDITMASSLSAQASVAYGKETIQDTIAYLGFAE